MLEVYDKNRIRLAILQNAFNIVETERINAISEFSFSLPDEDPKNEHCQPFNLIRYGNGQVYRIMPTAADESEEGAVTYKCEHILAVLIDTIMFGFVNIGGLGYNTTQSIKYVLNRQKQQDWILANNDFSRYFEYGWEQENLLAALFSIPNRFVDDYMWVMDTSIYPYKISLKLLDMNRNPDHHIRKGHNRLALTKQSDPRQICTRLYPLGAGEGVNQLGIKELNNGIPYLQSPQSYIDKYSLIERAWVDRRYTDQQSLLEAAQSMLNELQNPYLQYEAEFIGDCKVGDIVQIVGGIKSVITEITTRHEEIPQRSIKIANKPRSIADTVADLADRQRIEMTYSQGATQIYADSRDGNADANHPVEVRFFISDAMINVNAIMCKIRLSPFRAYSKASDGGGAFSQTSSSGGHHVEMFDPPQLWTGAVTLPSVPSTHNHSFKQAGFKVDFPEHDHVVEVPNHIHEITPVIELFGNPSSFWLLINGVKKQFFASRDAEVDITSLLVEDGKIPRGVWHTIGVLPDGLAQAEISYNIQGFVQSRGDKTV